jgi:5-methylcytosine-specific restriction enzyme subunit McrC
MRNSKPSIPIANLYYLLAYAWNHYVPGDETDLATEDFDNIHDLLASVLCRGIRRLAVRGLDKHYSENIEQAARLRGRVLLADSYRRLTHRSGTMICEFDELSIDTLPNRILKTTVDQLLTVQFIDKKIRPDVRHAQRLLQGITPNAVNSRVFNQVQLHRNNKHYRLLLHICRLLHESLLPGEETGHSRFRDILTDETRMPQLFEKFVFNFAEMHLKNTKVSSGRIQWHDATTDGKVLSVLPTMLTDLTLEAANRNTILDCKFYKEALVARKEKLRFHSLHLYQLNAYLQNKAKQPGWEQVDGILLYPAVDHDCDYRFRLLGHNAQVRSVDLDKTWPQIETQLIGILRGIDLSDSDS